LDLADAFKVMKKEKNFSYCYYKMAYCAYCVVCLLCRRALEGSVIIEDHFSFPQSILEQNMPTTSTPSKLSNLIKLDKELAWIGSLESLKLFVQSDLNIEGQWTSPGGEVKQFTSENYTMKWYGRKKKKLVITRDDKNESLRKKLTEFTTLNKAIIHDIDKQYGEAEGKRSEGNSNMVEVIESDDGKYDSDHITANQDDPSSSKIETVVEGGHKFTNSQCYCRDLALQLKRVERDIHQLKNRAETRDVNENTRVCNTNTCQREKALLRSNLEEANNTIKDLKAKIMYLEQEKDNLATAMTLQQKDYQTCLNNLRAVVCSEK
jgi:hypothetical protein